MGKYFLSLIGAILLSACTTVNLPSNQYVIGDVFTDRINVGPNGSYAPLPEGEWELIGKGRVIIPDYNGKGYVNLWLAQFDGDGIKSLIQTETTDFLFDYAVPPATYCKDDRYYYTEVRSLTSIISDVNDCLILRHEILEENFYAQDFEKQVIRDLEQRIIGLPVTMVGAHFVKTNKTSAIEVKYYFNPLLEGLYDDTAQMYRWSRSKWAKWRLDRKDADWKVRDREDRIIYYDKILTWAKEWESKVDAGLLGEKQTN